MLDCDGTTVGLVKDFIFLVPPSDKTRCDQKFLSRQCSSDTYITEDGASISELSEERVLCGGERVIVRLRFVLLVFLLVLDLKTKKHREQCD